jgi:hypothetical protein
MNIVTCEQVGRLLLAHARHFDGPRAVSPAKARLMAYPKGVNE